MPNKKTHQFEIQVWAQSLPHMQAGKLSFRMRTPGGAGFSGGPLQLDVAVPSHDLMIGRTKREAVQTILRHAYAKVADAWIDKACGEYSSDELDEIVRELEGSGGTSFPSMPPAPSPMGSRALSPSPSPSPSPKTKAADAAIEKAKDADSRECPDCKGTGQIQLFVQSVPCETCNGTGKL